MTVPRTTSSPTPASARSERVRAAVRFSIDDDLRFLSHHDELRLLVRALTRAGWPVAYSRGFNPLPRVVLPLPRSVGTASDCEWAIVELNESHPVEQLRQRLAAALPPACRLHDVVMPAPRAKPHPRRALYAVALAGKHVAQARERILELLAAETCVVERDHGPGKPTRMIDIRPHIETVTLDDCTLQMRLNFREQRGVRPTEVMTALKLPATTYGHHVCRVEVEWDIELADEETNPASVERKNVGQKKTCNTKTHDRTAHKAD